MTPVAAAHRAKVALIGLFPGPLACSMAISDGEVGTYTPSENAMNGDEIATSSATRPPSSGPPEAKRSEDCRLGTFVGEFSCELNPDGALPSPTLRGKLSFVFEDAPEDSQLEVADGELRVTVTGLTDGFAVALSAMLDCSTDEFSAEVFNDPFLLARLSGTLQGKLDRPTQTVNGAWAIRSSIPLISFECIGPFSVVKSP